MRSARERGVARALVLFIAARRGKAFTSLEAKAALPHLNWSSLRAHLHWMGRTGRLAVRREPGQKARVYRDFTKEERARRATLEEYGRGRHG